MNPVNHLLMAGILLLLASGAVAQPNIGGYNVYYGNLHNHSSISDGVNTPDAAYNYARNTGKLDFFSLSDHSGSIDATEWAAMKTAADKYNSAGVFTAFWGFEWTENYLGHVAVINPTNYITTASPYNTFEGLCTWLNNNECVAFFNHPGRNNSTGLEFNHLTGTPTDKIVGMELWNKTDRFETYYYTDGYFTGDGNKGFYDEALSRGWKIGAAGGEDNHSGTWGTMTPSKFAVLSTANTRTDIMNALKAKRFFTTYDLNLALSFKINNNEMGSTLSGGNYTLQIQSSDGSGDIFSQVQLLKNGTVVNTWNPNSASVNITQPVSCADGEYYYIRVKQSDGDEAISSPIRIVGGTVNISPVVSVTSPANNSIFYTPANLTITANASDSDGSVAKVEFYQGSTLLGEDIAAPYSFTWESAAAGSYLITAKATDNLGGVTLSDPVAVSVYNSGIPVTRSVVIAKGSDDAEESNAGVIYTNSTDIELVYDSYNAAGNQIVGLRFINLNIPRGATINNAYLQFTCDEVSTAACNLLIKGEAADNSTTFTGTSGNISSRTMTTASVNWTPASWGVIDVAGTDQRTPDLAPILQEIVNRPGFGLSGPITIIVTGSGSRIAEAYEGVPTAAAKLNVTFTVSPLVTPVFIPIGPLCQNAVPDPLPAISTNGITGTWAPATINTQASGTTNYTFTPNAGQGAATATMSVTINAQIAPVFTAIGPLSQGSSAPLLPTISTNGISGNWNPALISTSTVGTNAYTFTPAVSQCATTTVINISVISPTNLFSKQITAGIDDVEQYASGTMMTNSQDIQLVYDTKTTGNQIAGLRFNGITIPAGATITNAFIQFTSGAVNTATASLTIKGQKIANAPLFTKTKNNVSGRTKTTAGASWIPASWLSNGAVGTAQKTPELKGIVQEIVNISGWKSGNSMVFILTGTGTRTAKAYERSSTDAAKLYIEYTTLKSATIPDIAKIGAVSEPVHERKLTCFPVPFTNILNIGFTSAEDEKIREIAIYNSSGKLVKTLVSSENSIMLPLPGIQPGLYFLRVITNQGSYLKKVVKR
jgi:hypothetical protein